MTNSLLLKMVIEIVSCPIENGGSFHSYVAVYQRVSKKIRDDSHLPRLDWVLPDLSSIYGMLTNHRETRTTSPRPSGFVEMTWCPVWKMM